MPVEIKKKVSDMCIARLNERTGTLDDIARATGVPYNDVQRMLNPEFKFESISLERYFEILRALGVEARRVEFGSCEKVPVKIRRTVRTSVKAGPSEYHVG